MRAVRAASEPSRHQGDRLLAFRSITIMRTGSHKSGKQWDDMFPTVSRARVTTWLLALAIAVGLNLLVGSHAALFQVGPALAGGPAASGGSRFNKVMIVVLENTNYDDAVEQPFMRSLTDRAALLTRFSAETHPSQPNYLALISGSTHGVRDNGNVSIDAPHVGDLLEAKGLQWKVYAEGYPGNCYLGGKAGDYVRKHVPFLSFSNVQTNPARCARIVNAAQLSQDIQNGTLPNYSLYIPDERNDGHDTGVSYADEWLSTTFGPLLSDRRFMDGLLFVLTFDEGKTFPSSNHVLTLLFGDSVEPGARSDKSYNHYSLLRLVEDEFGLGTLGEKDADASAITGIWK
jgi:Phosphoesterase family